MSQKERGKPKEVLTWQPLAPEKLFAEVEFPSNPLFNDLNVAKRAIMHKACENDMLNGSSATTFGNALVLKILFSQHFH